MQPHPLYSCISCTTSRLNGIGKGAYLKRFRASHTFCEQAKVYHTHSASMHDVVDAGEKALVMESRLTHWTPSGVSGSVRRCMASKSSHVKLLKIIRCNCQADCSTLRCTCKRHNIECTPACSNCRGSGCTNTLHINDEDDDIDMLV